MNRRLLSMFNLPVIGQVPANVLFQPPFMAYDGVIPDLGTFAANLTGLFNFLGQNSQVNQQTSAAATLTLTNVQGAFVKLTNGGAVTVTMDYAYNIVNAMQNPYIGQTVPMQIMTTSGGTVATPTLSDTAVTLAGTTTVTTGGMRLYSTSIQQMVTVTGAQVTAGTTFTSIAQVGTTNAFTVTLATNTISPVVGSAIFINVTAGTLPPGWYPIVKVTSATSFIIATPPGTVWTATAATLPGTTVVPTSAYTQGLTLLPGQTTATAITGAQGL